MLPEDLKVDALVLLVQPKMRKIENISKAQAGKPFIYILMRNGKLERRDTAKFLAAWREKRKRAGLPPIG